jgi:alkanesulfonate monooxygenase SsuD/methylene tetrahydromethanopterin reductase-like flavin-dependent oxidoreductase (luciferase family)
MRYGLSLPAFGLYSDVRLVANLAREAERAGWDGFFVWDHMVFSPSFHPMADPWVALTAVAIQTEHVHLGTMLTPLARRRPWKVARETVSLDGLSNGRLVLGVGLGDPAPLEYGSFGEETNPKILAQKLDEGLEVLTGLWTGAPYSFQGRKYKLSEVVFRPRPVQQPRIPIWVGGFWPHKAPMRRAARWDGVIPLAWDRQLTPDDWLDILAYIRKYRDLDTPFEAVHLGRAPGDDAAKARDMVSSYAKVGVTWWVDEIDPWRFGLGRQEPLTPDVAERARERVLQGPPRI